MASERAHIPVLYPISWDWSHKALKQLHSLPRKFLKNREDFLFRQWEEGRFCSLLLLPGVWTDKLTQSALTHLLALSSTLSCGLTGDLVAGCHLQRLELIDRTGYEWSGHPSVIISEHLSKAFLQFPAYYSILPSWGILKYISFTE